MSNAQLVTVCVLTLEVGDPIALGPEDFSKLSAAFFDAIERTFVGRS